jgi:hypothetical protein
VADYRKAIALPNAVFNLSRAAAIEGTLNQHTFR